MVEVSDVRAFLKNISEDLLSDETIQVNLETANQIVEKEAGESVSFSTKERAKLLYASYLSFLSYATEVERTLGTAPPMLAAQVEALRNLAERFLEYVRRAKVTPQAKTALALTESLIDYVVA